MLKMGKHRRVGTKTKFLARVSTPAAVGQSSSERKMIDIDDDIFSVAWSQPAPFKTLQGKRSSLSRPRRLDGGVSSPDRLHLDGSSR